MRKLVVACLASLWPLNAAADDVGLIRDYMLQEVTGTTATDSSTVAVNGTLVTGNGDDFADIGGVPGPGGSFPLALRCVRANGVYLTIGASFNVGATKELTFTCWAKMDDVAAHQYVWRASNRSAGGALTRSLQMKHDGTLKPTPNYFDSVGNNELQGQFPVLLPYGEWAHLAMVVDSTSFRTYVNGILVQIDSSLANNADFGDYTDATILSDTFNHVDGDFAGVRLYNVAKTQAKIWEDMALGPDLAIVGPADTSIDVTTQQVHITQIVCENVIAEPELMTYELSGADAAKYQVTSTGKIRLREQATAADTDSITVEVTDRSGQTDSIDLTINITVEAPRVVAGIQGDAVYASRCPATTRDPYSFDVSELADESNMVTLTPASYANWSAALLANPGKDFGLTAGDYTSWGTLDLNFAWVYQGGEVHRRRYIKYIGTDDHLPPWERWNGTNGNAARVSKITGGSSGVDDNWLVHGLTVTNQSGSVIAVAHNFVYDWVDFGITTNAASCVRFSGGNDCGIQNCKLDNSVVTLTDLVGINVNADLGNNFFNFVIGCEVIDFPDGYQSTDIGGGYPTFFADGSCIINSVFRITAAYWTSLANGTNGHLENCIDLKLTTDGVSADPFIIRGVIGHGWRETVGGAGSGEFIKTNNYAGHYFAYDCYGSSFPIIYADESWPGDNPGGAFADRDVSVDGGAFWDIRASYGIANGGIAVAGTAFNTSLGTDLRNFTVANADALSFPTHASSPVDNTWTNVSTVNVTDPTQDP